MDVEIWSSCRLKREFLWSKDMPGAGVFLIENRGFNKDTYQKGKKEILNFHTNTDTGKDISIEDLALFIKKKQLIMVLLNL